MKNSGCTSIFSEFSDSRTSIKVNGVLNPNSIRYSVISQVSVSEATQKHIRSEP
jgi:hypothetical protein